MEFLSDEKKKKLQEFVKFVKKELGLETVPTIAILNGRGELKTTANYDYTKKNKIIKVRKNSFRISKNSVFFCSSIFS